MKKWLILFCAFLVFVFACRDDASKIDELAAECDTGNTEACKELTDIATKSDDKLVRGMAVKKLGDLSLLATIAERDKDFQIQKEAIKKISDIAMEVKDINFVTRAVEKLKNKELLAYIAKNNESSDIRVAAVKNPNLTDQSLLANIAKNDKDINVCMWAIDKISDLAVLAKIALEDVNLGNYTFFKLSTQVQMPRVNIENKDWRVLLINKCILAFNSIPTKYKERIIYDIWPAIQILNYPEVKSKIGDITSIKIKWNSTSGSYSNIGKVYGEVISCSIAVQKLPESMSHTWKSDFPDWILTHSNSPSRAAYVNPMDLVEKQFGLITDQALLIEIAKRETNSHVRIAAAENLIDDTISQSLFAEIATDYRTDAEVREASIKKITNQSVLYKIANDTKNTFAAMDAVKGLTDQTLLATIAKNHKLDTVVRIHAAWKLPDNHQLRRVLLASIADVLNLEDQSLLTEIGKNAIESDIRKMAVGKLTDQKLLADIARNDKDSDIREAAERRLKELQGK